MFLPRATVRLVPERPDIDRSKKLGDEASPGQREGRSTPRQEAESTAPARAEQSVLEPFAGAVAEGRPRGGLVALLSRISTDPLAVQNAWENLRSMIEEVVQREVQALEKRIGAEIRAAESKLRSEIGALASKLTSVESGMTLELDGLRSEMKSFRSELVMMRWVLGIIAASHITLIAVVIATFIFVANDRMDSRREVDPVEQTQGATLPEPGRVAADEAAASASGADLGIDTEPTRSPADEDPPEGRDVQ